MEQPTILVTAFGAFLDVRSNPAELVMRTLKLEGFGEGMTAEFELFDTSYGAVSRRLPELLALRPKVLVMIGYSRHATGLTLERRATNRRSTEHADAAGFLPQAAAAREVVLDNTSIDFGPLLTALAAHGIPAEVSDDAGEYVCNHCYFEALGAILVASLPTRAVFVHIPAIADPSAPPQGAGAMPLNQMVEGVRAIARELVR